MGTPVFSEQVLRSFRTRTRVLFASAVALLCLCAIATYVSFSYFKKSQALVTRTQEIRAAVDDLESTLDQAVRLRMSFLISGSNSDLIAYRTAVSRLPDQIVRLGNLVTQNPVQIDHWKQLQSVTTERLQTWDISLEQKQRGKPVALSWLLRQNMDFASRSAISIEAIRAEETGLLESRIRAAHHRFIIATLLVLSGFILALLMLYLHYILLNSQLGARAQAEQGVRGALARETSLRQESERFRLFINAVTDYAIFTLDSTGHVSSWNEGAERLKGYTAQEIIGKHFSQFYPEDDVRRGKPVWELEVALREGRIEDEGWRVRKDGSRFWANVIITTTRDQSGRLIGFTKVTRDFTERMRAQEELRRANTELEAEVVERTSAERRLAGSERSLRELSLHLLRTQDEERRRIGRDLHDSLGQYLAVLKMNLDSLQANVNGNQNGSAQEIENCVRLAEESLKEVRTISYLLYPPMLEEMGLKSAIPWYLDGFSKRSNIHVSFEVDAEIGRLYPEAELALFRVLQESLTNVHRHSGSATATVRLHRMTDNVVLEVKDKGKGIPEELLEQAGEDWMGSLGVGLRGMNERIRQLGGKLMVSSTEHGTTVRASIPATQHWAVSA